MTDKDTVNSAGYCAICDLQTIVYGIQDGAYTYRCLKCGPLAKSQVGNGPRNGGKSAALAMLPAFKDLATRLDSEDWRESEKAGHEAQEMPLEVLTRDGWYAPGNPDERELESEYAILFSTGGPAVRAYKTAGGAWELQGQDWGTPWERVCIEDAESLKAFDRVCDYILEANN
jgi:hypothetical protein